MQARWLILVLATLGPLTPESQAQEIQVAVDETGRIQVITPELARRLGLFAEVEGFREARLFQLLDGTFVLEVTSSPDGALRRDRLQLSAAEAAAFRGDVTSRVTARAPTAVLDRSGRLKLLVGSTVLGLGYYGWATAAAFDPDDEQTAVGLYMLTAAGSFLLPLMVTASSPVPDAVATMALWGATRGPIHGYLTSELGDAERDKTKFAWSVVLGTAEAIAGGLTARSLNMTPGRAEITGVGGDIGLGTSFAIAGVLKLDQRYRSITETYFDGMSYQNYTYQVNDRTLQSAVMLAGGALGLVGGYWLGGTEEWTRGDAAVFRNLTAIGGLTGLAVGDIIQQAKVITQINPDGSTYSYVEDGFFTRTQHAGSLIGAAAGLVLGHRLVTGRNFSTGQGTLLTLSPLAGGLLGLGIAYVATPERRYDFYDPQQPYRDPNDHSELYLTASALGAAAGFAVAYPAMARDARAQRSAANLRFTVNPLAVAQLVGGGRSRIPLGSVSYRF